jgi:hypothetical protein
MRRGIILLASMLVLMSVVASYATITRTNIDFSNYDAKIKQQYTDPEESYITNIEGLPKAVIGYKDYLLENWKIELNESASDLKNKVYSFCKPVTSQRWGTVLGARVHFPTWNNNSYALIKAPYDIQIYDTNGNFVNVENGVMPNVNDIKWVSVWVDGKNYPYQLAIRFRDRDSKIIEFYLGSLNFDGWRKLVAMNPYFTDRVDAKSLAKTPLYPKDVPYLVFDSIVVYRPAGAPGGDFVTYFKSIEMAYTPYIIDSDVTDDIKDEEVWQIITTQSLRKAAIMNQRLTEDIILHQQEKKRMDKVDAN